MIVNVERLNLNTERECNFCDDRKAVARAYTQTRYEYEAGIKNIAFHFCKACGLNLMEIIKVNSY